MLAGMDARTLLEWVAYFDLEAGRGEPERITDPAAIQALFRATADGSSR
jgi:hypothetical protein